MNSHGVARRLAHVLRQPEVRAGAGVRHVRARRQGPASRSDEHLVPGVPVRGSLGAADGPRQWVLEVRRPSAVAVSVSRPAGQPSSGWGVVSVARLLGDGYVAESSTTVEQGQGATDVGPTEAGTVRLSLSVRGAEPFSFVLQASVTSNDARARALQSAPPLPRKREVPIDTTGTRDLVQATCGRGDRVTRGNDQAWTVELEQPDELLLRQTAGLDGALVVLDASTGEPLRVECADPGQTWVTLVAHLEAGRYFVVSDGTTPGGRTALLTASLLEARSRGPQGGDDREGETPANAPLCRRGLSSWTRSGAGTTAGDPRIRRRPTGPMRLPPSTSTRSRPSGSCPSAPTSGAAPAARRSAWRPRGRARLQRAGLRSALPDWTARAARSGVAGARPGERGGAARHPGPDRRLLGRGRGAVLWLAAPPAARPQHARRDLGARAHPVLRTAKRGRRRRPPRDRAPPGSPRRAGRRGQPPRAVAPRPMRLRRAGARLRGAGRPAAGAAGRRGGGHVRDCRGVRRLSARRPTRLSRRSGQRGREAP